MSEYKAPVQDMQFVMKELAGLNEINTLPGYEEATEDLVDAILEEGARFHEGVIAPLNTLGDQQGASISNGKVQQTPGFKEAYLQYAEAGWNGLAMSPDYAGQGLPHVLAVAIEEMTQCANMAFSLCPMLTQGAINALQAHGSEAIKQTYLSKLISGEWTGTMNLTEPQAGSDLSVVRTRAVPEGDYYRISGQKIFITWGDHTMTDNIVHLVLARLPDAPEGTKGISLFVVPKYMVNADGSLGERNDVAPASIEHKLGIHASPTCVMSFGDNDGAIGHLVGEENKGLMAMFTMMNHARLSVGLQGLAVAERAYQHALGYAQERVQGRASNGEKTIINHPDVRRMLMLMRASNEASRALAYTTQAHVDKANHHPDTDTAKASQARVDLLTPIVKGWLTEMTNEVASLGVQVHGGMGFIEETGAAQHYRDARITAIYEGTNGIQALDLVGRKLIHDGGNAMNALLAEMEAVEIPGSLGQLATQFSTGIAQLREASEWILANRDTENLSETVCFNLLMLAGYVCGAWQMARAAAMAVEREDEVFYRNKRITAQFYCEHLLPRAGAHLAVIKAGADSTMGVEF